MTVHASSSDGRSPQQVREHYELEKSLARQLLQAPAAARKGLYSALYDELFRRLPHHPQLTRKVSAAEKARVVALQMRLLQRLLRPRSTFLEVGPGDCALCLEVAKQVAQVYAVDVSTEITKNLDAPANFRLLLSDGCSIPVPEHSVDLAYSNQLMEHLHPEDAMQQLGNIYRALRPGGKYFCVTPNRLTGPHDVSKYFDQVASGFHLKEYTAHELIRLFKQVGFSALHLFVGGKGHYALIPAGPVVWGERLLSALPPRHARALARWVPGGTYAAIRLVATK